MRLRHIEVFHAVYSTGSVTSAAAVLNVSQPSVSKVLAHAEQQLGFPLFDRVKGKLVPTQEADRLFAHIAPVHDSLDRLQHVAANLRVAKTGRIRIAATPAFGTDLLPSAVAAYLKNHGGTVFEIETLHHDEICSALLESRLDIGLAFSPDIVPGIATETLAESRFVVLTPSDIDFGDKTSVRLDDLAGLPFIRLDNRGPLGRLLSTHIESSGDSLNTIAYAETYHVAKALVSYGAGSTITDEITARSKGLGNVRVWFLEPALRFKIAALHFDKVPLSVASRKFVDHLNESIRDFLELP
jgi:DNA-binding transcriptional LysR family regulator